MKVSELIDLLKQQPQDAEVMGFYDGAARLEVEEVWLAQSGKVILGERGDAACAYIEDSDRPVGAVETGG